MQMYGICNNCNSLTVVQDRKHDCTGRLTCGLLWQQLKQCLTLISEALLQSQPAQLWLHAQWLHYLQHPIWPSGLGFLLHAFLL